jgi:hypothetical protein
MEIPKSTTETQVKSKKRVSDHGEVFTNQREVNAMLDLVKLETERIDSRFLEPACGNGNFLAEVLKRKLHSVTSKYKKSQLEWEQYSVTAVSSIYGVDILEDNAKECRERLLDLYQEFYTKLFKDCDDSVLQSVNYLLGRNILWGDALDFKNPVTRESIIFSEWSSVHGNMIQRRDYRFKFLVEQTHQFSMFNDQGEQAEIDEPVKSDYPLVRYNQLHCSYE